MKKALAISLILIMAGCASLLKITEGALSFINTVDDKVKLYHELGYIPDLAFDTYKGLKERAKAEWEEHKGELLSWVIEFVIKNVAARAGADVTAEEANRNILISAEMNLTHADYMKLKRSVQ